jgi:DNA-binding HxlR family transcriptional regulator
MQRTSFAGMACSLARTLEVIGDWWTPLIVRDLGLGITRFGAIQRNLGLSRKVLAQRLAALVDAEIVQRQAYQEHPVRYDYFLTQKGAELAVVLATLGAWGDRWVSEDGAPIVWRHERCGQLTQPQITCACCGEELRVGEVVPFPGPGADPGPGTSEIPAALSRIHAALGVDGPP